MLSSTFAVALDSHPLDVQVARHKPQGIIFLLNTRFKPTRTCEGEERKEGGGERGRREEGGRGRRERRRGGGRREEGRGGGRMGEEVRREGLLPDTKSMYVTIHFPLPFPSYTAQQPLQSH